MLAELGMHTDLIAVALSSRRALWAGLQSTETTCPAPCSSRLRELQPPLDSVSTVSRLLMFRTCNKQQHSVDMSQVCLPRCVDSAKSETWTFFTCSYPDVLTFPTNRCKTWTRMQGNSSMNADMLLGIMTYVSSSAAVRKANLTCKLCCLVHHLM